MSTTIYAAIAALAVAILALVIRLRTRGLRATPQQLKPGSPLPDFRATDE